MQLFTARTITLGFILAFVQLVTTPAPVLCSHDCGDIHVMGAAEHLGHEQHADQDAHDHGDGHGCKRETSEDAHDNADCVDISIAVDSLLPPSNSTDVQMPILDGYGASRAIRAWEAENKKPPTPICALTAHAMREDVKKSLDAGCDTHLTKPIKKTVLLDAIETFRKR